MKRQHTAAVSALTLLVAFAAGTAAYAALRLKASARLARAGHAFAHEAEAEGARLLVVGDSTARGTGASGAACSVPGLLSRANPSLTVVNRAREGAGFDEVLAQLDGRERFDAVLVLAGGIDLLRGTREAALRDAVRQVAQRARLQAELVVFMPPGNLAHVPFFLPPWNWWLGWRSRRLHAIVAETAAANGARYVSLLSDRDVDPFARHPKRMRGRDGLHPNDAGYELWQRELETQAQLSAKLRRIGRSAAARGPAI